jgi:probable HAF family extracellular repeat protein
MWNRFPTQSVTLLATYTFGSGSARSVSQGENMTLSKSALSVAAAFMLLLCPSLAQSQSNHAFLWTATGGMQDLGVPSGWTDSFALAISKSGQVVGLVDSTITGNMTAALWTAKNGWRPLKGGLSSLSSFAYGINSSGQVVGGTNVGGTTQHAFLWTLTGGMQDLGTLGGDFSVAYGINRLGQVVGQSTTASGSYHGFLWSQGTGMQDLGVIDVGTNSGSVAYAINDNGVEAGNSLGQEGSPVAVVWVNGKIQTLGHFPPAAPGVEIRVAPASGATSVNNQRQVVGSYGNVNSGYAFLWTRLDGIQDLGTIGGATRSYATGINASGEVVGANIMEDGSRTAFVWTSDGGMQPIGTLGSTSIAEAINDAGQVVGYSEVQ